MDQAYPRNGLWCCGPNGGHVCAAPTNLFAAWRQGDLIEVEGVTDPGQFAPIVLARTARKLGTAPVPAPRMVTYQQLITGALDAQWLNAGVVRRCIGPEPGADIMRLEIAPTAASSRRDCSSSASRKSRRMPKCASGRFVLSIQPKRQVTAPYCRCPGACRCWWKTRAGRSVCRAGLFGGEPAAIFP